MLSILIFILIIYYISSKSLILSSISDITIIKQSPLLELGSLSTLDLYLNTHLSFILYDISEIYNIYNYTDLFRTKLIFNVIWSQDNVSPIIIKQAFMNKPKWTEDNFLHYEFNSSSSSCHPYNEKETDISTCRLRQRVERVGPQLDMTYATTNSIIEFDITKVIKDSLLGNSKCSCDDDYSPEICHECQKSYQYISFQLSTSRNTWVKVASKDSQIPNTRPSLVIYKDSVDLSQSVHADAGVIRQDPHLSCGARPTLDLIGETHVAFMQFALTEDLLFKLKNHMLTPSNLFITSPASTNSNTCACASEKSICENSNSIYCWFSSFYRENSPSIKLRMYVDWTESHGTAVAVSLVRLSSSIEQPEFNWNSARNYYNFQSTRYEHAFSHSTLDFDITNIVQTYIDSIEKFPIDNFDLPHQMINETHILQFKISTPSFSWVKFASKEYPTITCRPYLFLTTMTLWDRIMEYAWVFHYVYIFIVRPMQTTLAAILLVYIIFFVRKIFAPKSKIIAE